MKTITIDELERLAPDSCSIVDIRPAADFARGSFPGAINIPMEELELRMGELEQAKPFICYAIRERKVWTMWKCWSLPATRQEIFSGATVLI